MTALHQSLRFFLECAPVILLAPAFYWLSGLFLARVTGRVEWAMMWGVGLMGLVGELACIAGIPARLATVTAAAAAIAVAVYQLARRAPGRTGIDWAGELRRNSESYLISLLAVSAVPFALPGPWGGDWLFALDSGRYIADGRSFYPDLLARPPFFGAAFIPICKFAGPLESFQVFCAVASACMLQVARTFIPSERPRLIWLLGASVFFLHITANAWPKILAAAFVIAAWISCGENGRRRDWVTGALLGLSLATHQSGILFVPFVLARMLVRAPSPRRFAGGCAVSLAVAAAICLPWEIYTLATYGLTSKLEANPTVSQRPVGIPVWLNTLLVGVSTFVAWGPVQVLRHWARSESPLSPA